MKIIDKIHIKNRLLRSRKIDYLTGCWIGVGYIESNGYARIMVNGIRESVHRLSYEIFIGPLKKQCLHKTICPNRHCFNPAHLYDGSQAQNILDSVKIGTHFHASKTYCKYGHEYTKENTYIEPNGKRCKICKKLDSKKYYAKKKLKLKEKI